jgi:hypothetical protein
MVIFEASLLCWAGSLEIGSGSVENLYAALA